MLKKVFAFVLTLSMMLVFTSCGLDYRYYLDEDLHNQIELVWGEDQPSHIIYQDTKYNYEGTTGQFDCGLGSDYDDVILSWNGYRYIGYIQEYYSYTSENPLYIFERQGRRVYFREDYDYLTDTFTVNDSDEGIVFQDIFGPKQDYITIDYQKYVSIFLRSKQHHSIGVWLDVCRIGEQWVISMSDTNDVWLASEQFSKILSNMDF